jgi:hypothetical protein
VENRFPSSKTSIINGMKLVVTVLHIRYVAYPELLQVSLSYVSTVIFNWYSSIFLLSYIRFLHGAESSM